MTVYVGFLGGPGTGKSTISAKTFSLLKESGLRTEMAREFVKKWAWQEKIPVKADQFKIFGEQVDEENSLANKVDFVISDAPLLICSYYTQVHGDVSTAIVFRSMVYEYMRLMKSEGHSFHFFWLDRCNTYQKEGRWQTEEEAKAIDVDLLKFLDSLKISYTRVPADPSAAQKCYEDIKRNFSDRPNQR